MGTGLRRIDPSTRAVITREFKDGVTLYEYDESGNIVYIMTHKDQDAPTSADGWIIEKFTYGANGITVREKLVGICDNRATLAWRT